MAKHIGSLKDQEAKTKAAIENFKVSKQDIDSQLTAQNLQQFRSKPNEENTDTMARYKEAVYQVTQTFQRDKDEAKKI